MKHFVFVICSLFVFCCFFAGGLFVLHCKGCDPFCGSVFKTTESSCYHLLSWCFQWEQQFRMRTQTKPNFLQSVKVWAHFSMKCSMQDLILTSMSFLESFFHCWLWFSQELFAKRWNWSLWFHTFLLRSVSPSMSGSCYSVDSFLVWQNYDFEEQDFNQFFQKNFMTKSSFLKCIITKSVSSKTCPHILWANRSIFTMNYKLPIFGRKNLFQSVWFEH